MQPFIVWGIFFATTRDISQGSSFKSRTNFFMKIPVTGTSMASKPARSMNSAVASIMPVRMPRAHRLWDPSRNVVSIKRTSMAKSVQPPGGQTSPRSRPKPALFPLDPGALHHARPLLALLPYQRAEALARSAERLDILRGEAFQHFGRRKRARTRLVQPLDRALRRRGRRIQAEPHPRPQAPPPPAPPP